MFEDGVLRWAEGELGPIRTEENGGAIFRKAIGFPVGSHLDGEVIANNEPVEAKTAGLFGPLVEPWGEPGTDQLPDRIIVQCHVHLLCTSKDICHVPVFLGGKGFIMYRVEQDHEIMDVIRDNSLDFWENFVEKDIPPPDVIPSLALAKRMKREPEKVVEIETQIVQNWLNAKESLKIAKDIKESSEAELLAALGDAEGGQCDLGLVTYFMQSRSTIPAKELKLAHPEIYEKLVNVSEFRVARLKKPKPEKF
jgi:predicted phage-related endonuclease